MLVILPTGVQSCSDEPPACPASYIAAAADVTFPGLCSRSGADGPEDDRQGRRGQDLTLRGVKTWARYIFQRIKLIFF